MEVVIMVGQLFLALGLLVFIHELGHFLAARAFGIKVEKFYIFFDFNGIKLFSKQIGDTEYGIGWFPLGGYVKIAGMIDESMDIEQMKSEPQPWEFRSKPAWQRLIVMLGGIIMNIILGIIIFTFTLSYYSKEYINPADVKDGIYSYEIGQNIGFKTGDQIVSVDGSTPTRDNDLTSGAMVFGADVKVIRDGKEMIVNVPDTLFKRIQGAKDFYIAYHNFPFAVDSVIPFYDRAQTVATTASKIGMKKGDVIVSINNEPVKVYGDVKTLLVKNDSMPADIVINRNGELLTFHVDTIKGAALGFRPTQPYTTTPYTLGRAIKFGAKDGFSAIYYNAIGLGRVFTGQIPVRESFQSPIGIAQIYGGVWVWARFWFLTGLISFILAFMNLLPIPALDGGHVVFIIIEVIQGKPVSEKTMENAQKVGLVIILGLMIFTFGNDILKLFNI